MAARLSEDQSVSVLLLEAGPERDQLVRGRGTSAVERMRPPRDNVPTAHPMPLASGGYAVAAPLAQMVRWPALYTLLQQGALDWKFVAEPQASQNQRSSLWPRGRVLGGCSSINAMIYVRGDARACRALSGSPPPPPASTRTSSSAPFQETHCMANDGSCRRRKL